MEESNKLTAKEYLKALSVEDESNHNWIDPKNDPKTSDLMESFYQAKLKESGVVEALEILLKAKSIKDTEGKTDEYIELKDLGWVAAGQALKQIK